MAVADFVRKALRIGRRAAEPQRDTATYPAILQFGQRRPGQKTVVKPSTRNLRHFAKTPYARRAINAIKNPVSMLDWEIAPLPGVTETAELKRQIEVATYCLHNPNHDDSFRSLIEQVLEDVLISAGAIETQVSGDALRPLWLWPVDGLSIQIYPGWTGARDEARYAQSIGKGAFSTPGETVPLRDDELIYIRPNPSTSTPFGLAPLEVAFLSISRQLGVGEFAGKLASNAKPSVMIEMGENADQDAVTAFRAYWTNQIEGEGITPIVGNGGDVHRLFPDGDDALFLKYQDFLKSEIATAFDLSPMNLGVERDVNRSTAEISQERDWDQAIKPRAKDIESYLTRQAIHQRLGFYQLRFRFVGLDRVDEDLQSKTFETRYKNNAVTPDEYRETIGLPPSDNDWGGKTYADMMIAIQAARGANQVLDDDLDAPKPLPIKNPDRTKD
jgi:HK97 family phage portal protein